MSQLLLPDAPFPHSTFRGLDVAVKTMILRDDADKEEVVNDFKLEVGIMSKIAHHPKLCLFLGASVVEPLTVITEAMSGGSVRGLLEKSKVSAAAIEARCLLPVRLLPAASQVAALIGRFRVVGGAGAAAMGAACGDRSRRRARHGLPPQVRPARHPPRPENGQYAADAARPRQAS